MEESKVWDTEHQGMFYVIPADYKSYLPEIYRNTVEVDKLADIINGELDDIAAKIKEMVNNKFVAASDEIGVGRWEKMLGVTSPLNGSLDSRRAAVRSAMMAYPPINESAIKKIIEEYMGINVCLSVDGYVISVRYRGNQKIPDLAPLYDTLYKLIPAAMLLDIAYAYLTWSELDEQNMIFDELDAEDVTFEEFERGAFIE